MAAEPASTVENLWHKIIAGIFAAVVAPVLVAFGVKFSDKVLTPATPPAASAPATPATASATPAAAAPATAAAPAVGTAPAVATAPAVTPGLVPPPLPPNPAAALPGGLPPLPGAPPAASSAGASGLAAATANQPAGNTASASQVPLPSFKKPLSQAQRLFNGRDLTGFYSYLGHPKPKAKAYGKNYDPDKVFSVQDGLLRVSGETPGVLETVKEYSDYWLTVEYKWGENGGPNADMSHHSAVLLNIQGADGAIHGAFPCSFHAQIMQGSTGDLFIASGSGEQHYSLTAAVEEKQLAKAKLPFYTPGAPRTTFVQGVVKRYAPGGPAATGIRAGDNLERPAGEWNTLDCVALNGKIFIRLNDHVVNFATDVTPAGGRIGIQSHGAEIFFREITLQPYNKHHDQGSGSQAAN